MKDEKNWRWTERPRREKVWITRPRSAEQGSWGLKELEKSDSPHLVWPRCFWWVTSGSKIYLHRFLVLFQGTVKIIWLPCRHNDARLEPCTLEGEPGSLRVQGWSELHSKFKASSDYTKRCYLKMPCRKLWLCYFAMIWNSLRSPALREIDP